MKNIHFASYGPACFAASATTALLFCLFSKEILNAAGELLTRILELSGDNPKIFFILGSFFTTTSIHTSQLLRLLLTYQTVCGSGLCYLPISQEFAAQQ